MTDPPRLLHRHSEYGYTTQPREAIEGEPEAVSADYQRRLANGAETAEREREREAIAAAAEVIRAALDALTARKLSPTVRATARSMARQLDKLEGKGS